MAAAARSIPTTSKRPAVAEAGAKGQGAAVVAEIALPPRRA